MSVTVTGATIDRSATEDIKFTREVTVVFTVKTSDKRDGPIQVLNAAGLPSIGAQYSVGNDFDLQLICTRRSAKPKDNDPQTWSVTCRFSNDTEDIDKDPNEQSPNPLYESPDVQIGGNQNRELVPGYFQDPTTGSSATSFDDGIVTPANEMFNPQPEYDVHRPVFTITHNVSSISPSGMGAWANAVNATTYIGAPPRTLRMIAPTAQVQYDETIGRYWRVTYGFEYRREKWDLQILNRGSIFRTSTGGYKRTWEAKTSTGGALPDLVLLTSTGGKIDPGSTARSYTTIRAYKERNFNTLNFSSTLFQ
uniref:Uncharacterized protein n=1 Tax=viral metagenome TaxID=1070528 RepID=A0A6M3L9M7_9ZZZZ